VEATPFDFWANTSVLSLQVILIQEHGVKITTKGQVTIPQDIREKTGMHPGTEVRFRQGKDGRVYLEPIDSTSRGKALVARMRGRGGVRMSTDEILALTRGAR
jgi:AbrB family looped-hinge helix DNA binding protein